MENKKEIVVLSGAGHKGIVKIQNVSSKENTVKGECNLDFRPSNASLYLVGDKIAKIRLHDTNTAFEVPFCATTEFGCVVRSSSVTMFGGNIPNGKILRRIDEYNKQKTVSESTKTAMQSTNANAEKQPEDNSENAKIGMTLKDVKLDEWTKYDGNNFYFAVKPQIDEMFVCYPEEKTLCDAVPNSKWVRVDVKDGYYVVGVLFNEDDPSFICYGVPSPQKAEPPKELQNACVWLPVGDGGYWIIYQSARNGEIVK